MATFVSGAALLAWATPAVSASVIFVWLADPDGGLVDWTLSRLPHWLGGGAQWAGFSWTNSALPAYTLLTVLLLWQGFPFIAVTVLAGLKTVPAELHESALVDGAGPWRVFWRILLPLTAPGLVATSVFAFIFAWNEFVFALTFLGTDTAKYTLPIYVQYFYGRGSVDWGGIMAASTLFTIPVMVFFLIVQRRMVNGLVAGAVKG